MRRKQAYFSRSAFTLIELLIVVAIIAILAAIAVPNFLEAQVRSKVSRCQSDFRSVAVALEAFRVDNNMYPPSWSESAAGNRRYWQYAGYYSPLWVLMTDPQYQYHWDNYPRASLTSPVAYITTPITDPFLPKGLYLTSSGSYDFGLQYGCDEDAKKAWVLESVGPDQDADPASAGAIEVDYPKAAGNNAGSFATLYRNNPMQCKQLFLVGDPAQSQAGQLWTGSYDATNGTKSGGDIVRMNY